jgi:hypothetical protein
MVSHPVLNLHGKENWGTVLAGTSEEIAPTDSDDEAELDYEFVSSPEKVPSWASKLKSKMKKLFCIESQGQYRAHVADKKARSRDKAMMRHLGMDVTSGCEDRITEEEPWIAQHCKWSDSETERHHAAAEQSEEDEDSDEHGDSDEYKEY